MNTFLPEIPPKHIVPIGLTFEDKVRPGTVVVAHVGEVLALDEWPLDDPRQLTAAIAERLLDVALTADVRSLAIAPRQSSRRSGLIALAAWWGRIIHKVPIELARRIALLLSSDSELSPDG